MLHECLNQQINENLTITDIIDAIVDPRVLKKETNNEIDLVVTWICDNNYY